VSIAVRHGTYSIVARDPGNGELGVAVQSHWFSVGSVVSWAEAGVGAVATQSIAEPAYGPRLLQRLKREESPANSLQALLDADPQAAVRQVAVVDSRGTVAVHTGEGCIPHAGDTQGDGFSVQANMMSSAAVWPAMAEGYTGASGSLARRMLTALRAGEEAGGDVRGRQSAALLLVPADGEAWRALVDLRIEDHPEPVEELARLLDLHDAYRVASEADELAGAGRYEEAAERYRRASELSPDNPELQFWGGLGLAHQGDVALGARMVSRAIEANAGWEELLARLGPEIAPGAEAVRDALGANPAGR
jgi:uncharacterized Ntn-hydrolase superfamily protein